MKSVDGKVAFVTGGASGIGLGMAKAFLDAGMAVMIADMEEEALNNTVGELAKIHGNKISGVPCDVTDIKQLEEARDKTLRHFGKVNVLCNNAGVGGGGGPMLDPDMKSWDWTLDVNLQGVLNGMAVFGPTLSGNDEEGHVVNTASMAGHIAGPNMGSYSASKFAVVAMSESQRAELNAMGGKVGISVLCPGFVATNIADSDRNRDEKYGKGRQPDVDPKVLETMRDQFKQMLAGGLNPRVVGELVLQGILEDRFYIFTAPELYDVLDERIERIKSDYAVVQGKLDELVPRFS